MQAIIAFIVVLTAASALAAATPIVEGVQSPAWVERAGQREPLKVGMRLENMDRVVSGDDARILLRMPEGSLVKLGANGQLALDKLLARREPQGSFFAASLDVVRGAFRFTTQLASRFQGRREVDVRIATVTAGIRGTDLWGKAADDRDIVCLIEGKITVQRDGDAQFAMDQPLSFYIAPKNAPALPVQPVPAEKLTEWAAETEIQPGRGATRAGGRWQVHAAEVDTQRAALAVYDHLRAAGYPAEIRPHVTAAGIVYRVRVANLPSEDEARALADRIRAIAGVSEPRVARG